MLRRVREYMEFKLGHKTYVGMLHRLDRDTSGSLAVALSKDAHAAGRELFKAHRFERHYLALVQGIPDPPKGTIHARISSGYRDGRRKLVDADKSGLDATTDYKVRERLKDAALLELRLHTGPATSDQAASGKARTPVDRRACVLGRQATRPRPTGPANRNMLHAWTLAFPHPMNGTRIGVEADPLQDFQKLLARLRAARD